MSEWCLSEELPRLIEEKNPRPEVDELMAVEGAALFMKLTPACVYTLLKKGKLKGIQISAIDKPKARPSWRIRKSEVEKFLDGK